MFLGTSIDMGAVPGLLNGKARQLQDDGALRKKGLDHHNKAKGKDMVTKIFVLYRSLKDLFKHLPTGRCIVDLGPYKRYRLDSRSSALVF